MNEHRGFTAELLALEDDPEIGREVIRIRHDDGRVEELHLHDYERLYSLPGVYEEIVSERQGADHRRRSPRCARYSEPTSSRPPGPPRCAIVLASTRTT